jgi:L-2,4-diaminobutyrate decarboxylase
MMAPVVLDGARDLGAPGFFAHMDPPTPWITWAVSQWTASRNQNLLHPDVAPTARDLEQRVVGWFAPLFGMNGGHMTPGSTVANLTALWAAREAGCVEVVSTPNAHLSVKKAAHILGMDYRMVDWADSHDLSSSAAVITAGATSTGEIERLDAAHTARWRHVDAAWSGPLRLSATHRHLLEGIESADSVSMSAHKWLFQPKESAFVMFADTESAHRSVTLDGAYLSTPNVGLLGSHGATAAPLAATLLAYGFDGVASWIDHTMELADQLHKLIVDHPALEARTPPQSGVVNWRRIDRRAPRLGQVFVSTTTVDGENWLRSVAANPMADPDLIVTTIGG